MSASSQSVRTVAAWLAEQAVQGVRGGPVTKSTVQRMLTEPFYAGFVQDASGRLTLGRHEALVSQATFALVQRKLFDKRNTSLKTNGTSQPDKQVEMSHVVGQTTR